MKLLKFLKNIGNFIHLKDDLTFNVSLMAGTTLAIFTIVPVYLINLFKENNIEAKIYLLWLFLLILFELAIWSNYLFIRRNIKE